MSALIGIAVLALFSIALFVAIPFVLAPLVLGGMYLHRRRQQTTEVPAVVASDTVAVAREETRSAVIVGSVAQAA